MSKHYRATCNFGYPSSPSIRNRLRGGEDIPIDERGDWTEYSAGDLIANPPTDMLRAWIAQGLIEEVADGAQK